MWGGEKTVLTIGQSAQFENDQGVWLAFADGNQEIVRARVTRAQPQHPSEVSVWWNGSATARGVRDWVCHTMNLLNPKVECRVKVWADDAPEETHSYGIDSVVQIADDIEKWTRDGAVACSIIDTRAKA